MVTMLKTIIFFAILSTIAGAVFGSTAALEVNGGTIQAFEIEAEIEVPNTVSSIDIEPEIVDNITIFIDLPDGYEIDYAGELSFYLFLGAGSCGEEGGITAIDIQGDNNQLQITFDGSEMASLMSEVSPPATVDVTVCGIINGDQIAWNTYIDIN
jgi:hypothetical protein